MARANRFRTWFHKEHRKRHLKTTQCCLVHKWNFSWEFFPYGYVSFLVYRVLSIVVLWQTKVSSSVRKQWSSMIVKHHWKQAKFLEASIFYLRKNESAFELANGVDGSGAVEGDRIAQLKPSRPGGHRQFLIFVFELRIQIPSLKPELGWQNGFFLQKCPIDEVFLPFSHLPSAKHWLPLISDKLSF